MRRAFTLQMHDPPGFKGWLVWCDHCESISSDGDVYESEERALAVTASYWCGECHSELLVMAEP